MTQMHDAEALTFDLYDRLSKSMRVSGHTAVTLGEALGVHRNTISNYLTGRSPLDRRTLIAWSFATGVPLTWLEMGQTPEPSPTPGPGVELPRLDSNQQPSGSRFAQVTGLRPVAA